MNSPCDFHETRHVGLACENDRRLHGNKNVKTPDPNQIPDPEAGKSGQFPVYPRPPLGSGITLIGALL
jgi:hypothetical protein